MASSQREALVILMDIGRASWSNDYETGSISYFDRAKSCIKKIIMRKILCNPDDEIGIVLFGCNHTNNDLNTSLSGFDNVYEMNSMQNGTWELVRKIEALEKGDVEGNWVKGMLVAINYMKNETEAKKIGSHRIILFTNFLTQVEEDDDLNVIIDQIVQNDIQLIAASSKLENSSQPKVLSKSEELFQVIGDKTENVIPCSMDTIESGLTYYTKGHGRSVPWNCALTIGEISINTSAFVYVQHEKMFPGFKTECIEHNTATKLTTEYFQNNKQIDKPSDDDIVKAYMYGSKLVAIDDPDIALDGGSKCLACLAFCKRSQILPDYLIGKGCHIVVPQKGFQKSANIFEALVEAMNKRNYAMVARKVYREGAKPHIVALIPKIEDESFYLLMYELAFDDDIEYIYFPKLERKDTQPSGEQMEAMKKLVELMDLTSESDEVFHQDALFNPAFQNMCQSIAFRVLNPDQPLPPVNEDVLKLIQTPDEIKARINSFMDEFDAVFPKEIVERKAKKPLGQTQDVEGVISLDDSDIYEELEADQRATFVVGSVTPAEDFYYLIKKGALLFRTLCEQIEGIIYEMIFKSCVDMEEKVKETIMAYREAAKIHGPFNYNEWIKNLKASMIKRDKIDLWNKIVVREGFGLISQTESPISTVTIDDQLTFYDTVSKESSRNLTSTPMDEDDNLEALL